MLVSCTDGFVEPDATGDDVVVEVTVGLDPGVTAGVVVPRGGCDVAAGPVGAIGDVPVFPGPGRVAGSRAGAGVGIGIPVKGLTIVWAMEWLTTVSANVGASSPATVIVRRDRGLMFFILNFGKARPYCRTSVVFDALLAEM